MSNILQQGAHELGIDLTDRQIEQFSIYTRMLLEWNQRFNLTRITEPDEIVIKHYLDSLTCLKAVEFSEGAMVADVGTGAGFPGIPLAIVRPDLRLVLIEATRKKLTFLEALLDALAHEYPDRLQVELLHARAEDAGRLPEHRERYYIVVARAVAAMPALARYCLPLVKVGGVFIAMKGPDIDDELNSARSIITNLGGSKPEIIRLTLPVADIQRSLVTIRKSKPTPVKYPNKIQ